MTDTSSVTDAQAPTTDSRYGIVTVHTDAILIATTAAGGASPDKSAVSGTITIDPRMRRGFVTDAVTGEIVLATPETIQLKGEESFEVTLLATDNPNLAPHGWDYMVTIRIEGEDPISLPISVPGGVTSSLGTLLLRAAVAADAAEPTTPTAPVPTSIVAITDNGDGTLTLTLED